MSKVAIEGNVSGTGTLTIAAPNTNTNRTITLPDATTTIVGTDATQTLTNKSIVATQLTGDVAAARITTALNATGSAPIFAARAWVNFNGTGTPAITGSGNVSSITDNGTGDYTVNFTTAISDALYCVQALAGVRNFISAIVRQFDSPGQSTTAVRVTCAEGTGSLADSPQFNVTIFR